MCVSRPRVCPFKGGGRGRMLLKRGEKGRYERCR